MIDADQGDDGDEQRSALRRQARRSRVLRMAYARFRQALRFARVQGETTKLRCSRRRLPPSPAHPNVVVSLTSFPARLEHAWISIETIFRQDHRPDRIVLVLAEDECSRHELPRKLREQQRRGLEILWTPRNTRSFNKLLPTRLAYPDATIITVDDDALYEPWLVSRVKDVDLKRMVITIRGAAVLGRRKAPKTSSSERLVAIDGDTAFVLEPLIKPHTNEMETLFHAPEGGLMDHEKLNRVFCNAQRALKITPIRGVYSTKDTFCSIYLTNGGAGPGCRSRRA